MNPGARPSVTEQQATEKGDTGAKLSPPKIDRRNFFGAGVAAVAAAVTEIGNGQERKSRLNQPGIPPSQSDRPQIAQRVIGQAIPDLRIAQIFLGEAKAGLIPGVTITKGPAKMPDFSVVKANGKGFAIVPKQPGTIVVGLDKLVFGTPQVIAKFGSINPELPTAEMAKARELRTKGKKAPGQSFPLMAEFARAMQCFRDEFPEETQCRIVTARILKPNSPDGAKIFVSNPFALPDSPDRVETGLKEIVAKFWEDQLEIARTGNSDQWRGVNAIRKFEADPVFSAFDRLARGLNVWVTEERIDEAQRYSKLGIQGVLVGNNGDGRINQPYVPKFAIIKGGVYDRVARMPGNLPPVR